MFLFNSLNKEFACGKGGECITRRVGRVGMGGDTKVQRSHVRRNTNLAVAGGGRVFLNRSACISGCEGEGFGLHRGRVIALDGATGTVLWDRRGNAAKGSTLWQAAALDGFNGFDIPTLVLAGAWIASRAGFMVNHPGRRHIRPQRSASDPLSDEHRHTVVPRHDLVIVAGRLANDVSTFGAVFVRDKQTA